MLAAAIFAAAVAAVRGARARAGHTLSSTDYLYSQIPWSAVAPAGYTAPSNTELYDPAFQFIPWLEYTRSELPGGDLLWNPHMAAGRPYLANMQSGIFSPFSLPSYLLPFWWSLGLVAALKLFLASFGTYLFARRLGQSFWGGLLAGCVFGFGLYVVVHLMYPIGSVYVLIPLLLVATDGVTRRPGPWPALALALLVALVARGRAPRVDLPRGRLSRWPGRSSGWRATRDRPAARAVAGLVRGRRPRRGGARGRGAAPVHRAAHALRRLRQPRGGGHHAADAAGCWPRRCRSTSAPPPTPPAAPSRLGAAGLFIARALYAGALPLMLALVAASRPSGRVRGTAVRGRGRAALPARGGGALPRPGVRPRRGSSTP